MFTCDTSNSPSQFSTSITNKMGTQAEADEVHLVKRCSSNGVQECQELSKTTTNSWDSPYGCHVVGNGKSSPVQNDDVHVIFSKVCYRNPEQELINTISNYPNKVLEFDEDNLFI